MKRLHRDPIKFDTFSLLTQHATKENLSLQDPGTLSKFLDTLKESANKSLSNRAFLHGQRTEALFEMVVASLGQVRLLKREDAGDVFHSFENEINIPDFRIIFNDDTQALVEVKNHYQGNSPLKEHREKSVYLESLSTYAKAMKCELLIATYWARWHMWTLVPEHCFSPKGKNRVLKMDDALKANLMGRLGDCWVATRAPLRLRIIAAPDSTQPTPTGKKIKGLIQSIEIYSENRQIIDELEWRIAFFLLLYGDWKESPPTTEKLNNNLIANEYQFNPAPEIAKEEPQKKQGFVGIGLLSRMTSNLYLNATTNEGEIARTLVNFSPGQIGQLIPNNYKGTALPLWRFTQSSPNTERQV
jgi:hypothetical protein